GRGMSNGVRRERAAASRESRRRATHPGDVTSARRAFGEGLPAQREELVERVLDRQLLHVREARFPGERTHASLADDGAEPLAAVGERHRETVQGAHALERLADGVAVLERVVGGVWLGPEEDAVVGEAGADGAQRVLRID